MSGVERKPLTVEQLRGMDGKPAYWPDDESCGIISVDDSGRWAGIPFFRGRKNGVNFEFDIEFRGMEVYAYPQARIDREKWEPCEKCKYTPENACRKCQNEICNAEYRYPCTGCNDQSRFVAKRFCQNCGRPLTEEAWEELERRCLG